jgi:peptidylprolyl isomerase
LQYVILKKGQPGLKPQPHSKVRVHYSGWTKDGKMFDSSVLRQRPIEFPLNRVIKGWSEGVQQMVVGDKFRFWVPQHIAYGDNPRPGAPQGDLVFEIELFAILVGN